MPGPTLRRCIAALAPIGLAAVLAACGPDTPTADPQPRPTEKLGLMTSLPLYWPLGADLADLANGNAPAPWQRAALERTYALVPLDTLTPIPGLTENDPEIDPLAGLRRLAVIQPRGLAPGDNVALDDWVREGGHLLLVLDPMLTGEYDLPLGDPRRPTDTALIPPVLARWGLKVVFDDQQDDAMRAVRFGKAMIPLHLSGEIQFTQPARPDCTLIAEGAGARCRMGAGRVTVLADAAVFEHEPGVTGRRDAIAALMAVAFE